MDDGLLIEQVASFPQLYVKSDPRYKNIRIKENAWKTIAVILEETPEVCEHRWKVLRNKYTALRREHRYTPSGSGATEITWPFFEVMRFLDPYLQTRRTFSNITIKRKPETKEWDLTETLFCNKLSQEQEKENSPEKSIDVGVSKSSPTKKEKNILNDNGASTSFGTPQHKRIMATIPRHTTPSKRQKTDILAEKMTGCFDTFQKVLETSSQCDTKQDDGDDHFIKSLVQDIKVFKKKKILIKREIYNVLSSHLDDSD